MGLGFIFGHYNEHFCFILLVSHFSVLLDLLFPFTIARVLCCQGSADTQHERLFEPISQCCFSCLQFQAVYVFNFQLSRHLGFCCGVF